MGLSKQITGYILFSCDGKGRYVPELMDIYQDADIDKYQQSTSLNDFIKDAVKTKTIPDNEMRLKISKKRVKITVEEIDD